jgi:lysophospholipase L1-like esterase
VFELTAYLTHGRRALATRTEQTHCEYDPLLGWVHRPEQRYPDLYGPGRTLTTNAQRLRGARAVDPTSPPAYRILCLGDSWTMGYGLDDAQTFAEVLSRGAHVEAVNMGMGGFGIDQAYLWYQRDGQVLPHDLLLLAITPPMLGRMCGTLAGPYPKPVLRLDPDGGLETRNVPVPRVASDPDLPWAHRAWLTSLTGRTVSALTREEPAAPSLAEAEQITRVVLRALRDGCRERGQALVLTFLPDQSALASDSPSDPPVRSLLADAAAELELTYVDLTESVRAEVRTEDQPTLYIAHDGHPSARGVEVMAARLQAFFRAQVAGYPAQAR